LRGIVDTLSREGIEDVQIRPELTGKPSQYGDLEELLGLASEIDRVWPCIDFSHLFARGAGAINSFEGFKHALERYRAVLGKKALQDLHLHLSGIEYTEKGERRHLDLKDSSLKYREVLRALKQAGASGVVICESPIPEDDALLLKRSYSRIRA
jgi:deoxyribonuclease-4